eukprot:gene12255-15597_t
MSTPISIIGAGGMATAIAGRTITAGHTVEVIGRDESKAQAFADKLGAGATTGTYGAAPKGDIVILAVPVAALSEAIATLRPHLRAGAIVVDVGSVKIGPATTMLAELPEDVEIVGTHPLFGPQSGRDGLDSLVAVLQEHGVELVARVATPDEFYRNPMVGEDADDQVVLHFYDFA